MHIDTGQCCFGATVVAIQHSVGLIAADNKAHIPFAGFNLGPFAFTSPRRAAKNSTLSPSATSAPSHLLWNIPSVHISRLCVLDGRRPDTGSSLMSSISKCCFRGICRPNLRCDFRAVSFASTVSAVASCCQSCSTCSSERLSRAQLSCASHGHVRRRDCCLNPAVHPGQQPRQQLHRAQWQDLTRKQDGWGFRQYKPSGVPIPI